MGKNKKISKEPIMIYVLPQVKKHIKTNARILSFSEWVQERYVKEEMNFEFLNDKLDKINVIRENIMGELHKKQKENKENDPPSKALIYLKTETPKIIRKCKERGALHKFNERYNLGFTMRQFRIWTQKLKSMSLEEIKSNFS